MSDPVGDAKFSSKSGPHAIGVLVARDRVNNLLVSRDLGSCRISRDEDVTAAVLRCRRDIGDGTTVGTVATAPEGTDGYRVLLGGLDAYPRPHSTISTNLQLLAIYNFSPRAFFRTTFQYRRTDRNPVTNPDLDRTLEESLATQALFSYKVNPLTVVFLGVSDDRLSLSSATPGGREQRHYNPSQ